jgi:hypothetical protein
VRLVLDTFRRAAARPRPPTLSVGAGCALLFPTGLSEDTRCQSLCELENGQRLGNSLRIGVRARNSHVCQQRRWLLPEWALNDLEDQNYGPLGPLI